MIGELREFVCAMVDNHLLSKASDDIGRAGQKGPRNRASKSKFPRGSSQRPDQKAAVDLLRDHISMKRNGHGRNDMDVLGNLAASTEERSEFLYNAAGVLDGSSGIPISDRVHPQDAVPAGKSCHDVLLA